LVFVVFAVVLTFAVWFYLAAPPQGKPHPNNPVILLDGAGESIPLSLNYTVGDQMVYDINYFVLKEVYNPEETQTYNFTSTQKVVDFDGNTYKINTKVTSTIDSSSHPAQDVNVSKPSFYKNFMAPGYPKAIFVDVSANPTLAAYLASNTVKAGDVWQIPVNTGNESFGMTGNMTFIFGNVQNLTVPAGTYAVFKIEVNSSPLTVHANLQPDPLNMNQINGRSIVLSGQTFLEYGTCRLIRAELQQETTLPSGDTGTMYTEQILQEHFVP
jgi:hypothetical protein